MDFFKENLIPEEILVQLLAFLCLFFLLKKFAWKPALKSLENRRERIRQEIDALEKTKKELEVLKSDYQTRLQKIEEEARAKIQNAVEEGRALSRDIQDHAREAAQKNLERAKENLDIEIDKARLQLKREIADLALRVAEKVIEEKMTETEQRAKTLKIIEELERSL